MLLFSVTTTLALALEVGYAQLVPKIPQLYAALIRAAVWDCVLIGVIVAQLIDLASTELLAGTDSPHFLPLAVLLYHAIVMSFCGIYDVCSRSTAARARTWHRTLVCRRVLLELAGGPSGGKLYLGRVCFLLSGGTMWVALRVILWIDDDNTVPCFVVLLFMAYCAAGLAAGELRHTMPGNLVQWLCTGWGVREALLQGPLKILGALLLLPFVASVLASQIWLRTVAFLVWLTVACPCCRLQQADNVFDAFERELALPLLQCSFLAFACTLATIVLGAHQLSSTQRIAVISAALYYTGMLVGWTGPAVLQGKVAAEEAKDLEAVLGDEGSTQLLPDEHGLPEELELEDLRSRCDEMRALLQRERHDHAVETGQLQGRLRDQELRTRTAERDLAKTSESANRLATEVKGWRERCGELRKQLACGGERPELPRLRLPDSTSNSLDPHPHPSTHLPTRPQDGLVVPNEHTGGASTETEAARGGSSDPTGSSDEEEDAIHVHENGVPPPPPPPPEPAAPAPPPEPAAPAPPPEPAAPAPAPEPAAPVQTEAHGDVLAAARGEFIKDTAGAESTASVADGGSMEADVEPAEATAPAALVGQE